MGGLRGHASWGNLLQSVHPLPLLRVVHEVHRCLGRLSVKVLRARLGPSPIESNEVCLRPVMRLRRSGKKTSPRRTPARCLLPVFFFFPPPPHPPPSFSMRSFAKHFRGNLDNKSQGGGRGARHELNGAVAVGHGGLRGASARSWRPGSGHRDAGGGIPSMPSGCRIGGRGVQPRKFKRRRPRPDDVVYA